MRLRRLILSRYGLFSGHEIDFGEPTAGKPDLHVIYGPNEAGKSTALAGFLDLLFAFEQRSRYGFKHGYEAMRVEADIEIGGKGHRFARIKKRIGSLLDGGGRQALEGLLINALGGMNRETYKAMFSLNDDTLEKGGEEILHSEGELGSLLFATGAGLSELSGTLKRLLDTAGGFHRGKARNTKLYELKTKLKGIEEERKKHDMEASAYAGLVKKRNLAKTAYDEAVSEHARLKAERTKAERRLRGLERLAEMQPLRVELADLASLPEPPRAWFERIDEMIDREPRLATEIEGLEKRRHEWKEECEALVVDDAILALEDRIANLEDLRAGHVQAGKDLPKRRSELDGCRGEIVAILRRLEQAPDKNPSTLAVPAAVIGALGDLIERWSGIEERVKAARKELEKAEAEAERAQRALDKAEAELGDDSAFEHLRTVLGEAQNDDWRSRHNRHTEQRRLCKAELDRQMAQLPFWNEDPENLAAIRVPEADDMDEWKRGLDEAIHEVEGLEAHRTRLQGERKRQDERAQRTKTESGVTDDEEAARLRKSRNEAWRHHRSTLDAGSADAFEARMNAYDAAMDGRLAQAAALADIRQAGKESRSRNAEIERNAEELAIARQRRQRLLDEIATSVQDMIETGASELPPDIARSRLAGWLRRRGEILETLAAMEREDAEIGRAREDENRHRDRLAAALTAAGVEADAAIAIEDLTKMAQMASDRAVERRAEVAAARGSLDRARSTLQNRRDEAKQAGNDDKKWHREWTVALSRCWLKEIEPEPPAPEMRHILESLKELEGAHEKHENMAARIAAMERDQNRFAAEIKSLLEQLSDSFDPTQVTAQGESLKSRRAAAIAARERRKDLLEKLERDREEIARTENEMAELRAVESDMFKAFGIDSLLGVKKKLQQVEQRTKLRSALADKENQLMTTMKTGSLEEAEALLEGADRAGIEEQITGLDTRIGDAENRKQERHYTFRKAEGDIAAVGGDDRAARLEQQRRTVLLDLEERALAYLRIRLGIAAAEEALRAYRDRHRSSMMENASQAFGTISRGAYERLASQPTDKGEVLIGIPTDGGAKLAHEMSKGARFQLYLALRVAGYREFVGQHGPVPFFADDILETFDDFRAEETFRVLTDMARSGQVIYLGHHRHLCRIAREVCPEVTIHELPDPMATAAAGLDERTGG